MAQVGEVETGDWVEFDGEPYLVIDVSPNNKRVLLDDPISEDEEWVSVAAVELIDSPDGKED